MTSIDTLPLLPRPRTVRRARGGFPGRKGPKGAAPAEWPSPETRADPTLGPQAYRLSIAPESVRLESADAAGAFYGRMTLRQLARLCPEAIPCGVIEDAPDIPVRGVMLDISRDKVPSMDTLFMLADMLAEWKVNHLQLYMEHTFAYRNHRDVWADASPLTADELIALDAYCRERFIELAPNQNSFGHFERWLKHGRYRALAECPDGFRRPDGSWREATTLDPANPASLDLVAELYAELIPNFTSRRLHIGCDETWELGAGRSRPEVERRGLGPVYFEYLSKLGNLARSHGCTAHYWGDMVWNHFGDRLDLPDREMVHVDWGYYRAYPYRKHGAKLAEAGMPFWVAPGTSTWMTLVGCNEAALGSNRSAAQCANEFGALGYLNTDWGDFGHWQNLPVSFIGLAAGAAMSWGEKQNTDEAIRAALDPHVFRDEAGVAGGVAYSLADTWTFTVDNATQSHLLDAILRGGLKQKLPEGVTEATLSRTDAHLAAAVAALSGSRMARPDAALVVDEFGVNAGMARHACRLGLALLRGEAGGAALRRELARDMREIIEARRRVWLARNRPGGLSDSLRVLEARAEEYEGA
jgi:hypothetical protein